MTKRLVQTGFTVIPHMGVLDEETDSVTPAEFPPIQVAPGGLTAFEHSEWPVKLAAVKGEFAKQQAEAEAAAAPPVDPAPPAAKPKAARKAKGSTKKVA